MAWEVITEEWMIRAGNEKQGMIGREGTVIRRKKMENRDLPENKYRVTTQGFTRSAEER